MRKRFILLSFISASLAFSQAPPTVIIRGIHQPSHGSVSVEFTWTGNTPNSIRAHTSAPNGTCASGTGGAFSYQGTQGEVTDRKYWPYDDAVSSPVVARAIFAGLLPNTTYQLCPEVSADNGNTYSTGAGITYTTQSLPAVHPANPIPPADVNTVYPDTTGYVTITPSCGYLTAETTNALNRQLGQGTIINMPDCDNAQFQFARPAADNITFQSVDVNVSNNTIGNVHYPGNTCGNGNTQVPCLTEGMGVRFGNFDTYNNVWPSHLHDPNHNQNGAVPYVFYVHFPNSGDTSNFQLFYPRPYSQCANCLWTLGSQGSTNATGLMFVEWPRPASLKYIIFRTPTPDANFAPVGTRITPAWDSKMFHFRNFTFSSAFYADGNQTGQIGNIWVVGMHGSFIPDGEISPRPVTYAAIYGHPQPMITTQQSDGPIIFDRCWFQGPPFPMRIANPITFDGAGMAITNSRIDGMYAWHPTSTWEGVTPYAGTIANGPVSGRTIAIPPGEAHGGLFNYVQRQTMTISITGTPADGLQHTGVIYFDSSGNVTTTLPVGMNGTTNIGSIVTNPDTIGGPVDLTSPLLPQENTGGQNRPSVFPIAFFAIGTDGAFFYLLPAGVQNSSCDWNGCEGSDTIIAGRGPGPVKFENNYFNWNGNFINFDDCLNPGPCGLETGDYTIRRNYFYHDSSTVRSSANWNGNLQLHRQGVEWKHGSRDWIVGNIFDGQNGCDNQNPTGTAILGKTISGDTNDINTEFNTVMHSCGFSGAGTYLFTNHLLADAMSRIRFANNLVFDDNGWKNSSYYGPATYHGSPGWLFQMNGPVEDLQIIHNTFLDHDGIKPAWIALREKAEGVSIDNNLLFYAQNPGAPGAVIVDSVFTDRAGHSGLGNCQALADKALLDCLWPGYTFRNNVVVPGNNSSNVWATPCNGGGDGDGCFTRRLMSASSQVSFSTVCGAFGGTVSGTACTGGLPSTVLNSQNGVANAVTALGFVNPTKSSDASYRLLSNSPIISGGQYKGTDGKDVGADMDALEKAQGRVTVVGVSGVTTSSAVVGFDAPDSQSCPVDFGSTNSALVTSFTRAADSGTQAGSRSVTLGGLISGTTYYYRINCATNQPSGMFRTN